MRKRSVPDGDRALAEAAAAKGEPHVLTAINKKRRQEARKKRDRPLQAGMRD